MNIIPLTRIVHEDSTARRIQVKPPAGRNNEFSMNIRSSLSRAGTGSQIKSAALKITLSFRRTTNPEGSFKEFRYFHAGVRISLALKQYPVPVIFKRNYRIWCKCSNMPIPRQNKRMPLPITLKIPRGRKRRFPTHDYEYPIY